MPAISKETQRPPVKAPLWSMEGRELGAVDLPAEVFGVPARTGFLHEVVTACLANRRRWTANTKTRSEVSGGGRKPWRQKHTGRARAGSNRSPIWRKGGVVFGPRTVDPAFKRMSLPRKKLRLALAQALSSRAADGGLKVLDAITLDGAKTSQVARMMKALGCGRTALIVVDQHDRNLALAGRNIRGARIMLASELNAYEVLRCQRVIMTTAAIEKIRSRWN